MKLLGPLPPLPSPRTMPGIVQQTMEMIAGGYYEICQKQLCVSMGLFYCNPFPFRSARMDGGQDDGRNMFSFLCWFTDSCILGSAVPVLGGYTTIVLVFTGVISPPFWVFNHTCTHLQPQLHPQVRERVPASTWPRMCRSLDTGWLGECSLWCNIMYQKNKYLRYSKNDRI